MPSRSLLLHVVHDDNCDRVISLHVQAKVRVVACPLLCPSSATSGPVPVVAAPYARDLYNASFTSLHSWHGWCAHEYPVMLAMSVLVVTSARRARVLAFPLHRYTRLPIVRCRIWIGCRSRGWDGSRGGSCWYVLPCYLHYRACAPWVMRRGWGCVHSLFRRGVSQGFSAGGGFRPQLIVLLQRRTRYCDAQSHETSINARHAARGYDCSARFAPLVEGEDRRPSGVIAV